MLPPRRRPSRQRQARVTPPPAHRPHPMPPLLCRRTCRASKTSWSARRPIWAQYDTLSQAERTNFAGTTVPAGFVSPVPVAASSESSSPRSAVAAGSSSGAGALQAALSKLGSSYAYGATGPNAFDCSELTQWAYKPVGISIPRTAEASGGAPVARDQLQPGDLVFFYSPISHVRIYAETATLCMPRPRASRSRSRRCSTCPSAELVATDQRVTATTVATRGWRPLCCGTGCPRLSR